MNELYPDLFRSPSDVQAGGTQFVGGTFGHSYVATSESSELDFEWEGRLGFRFPETMSEEEAKATLSELADRFGIGARVRSHLIIDGLPAQVVSAILPQLQDIAEYETRMWQVRREVKGPDVHERWVSLPITG